MTHPPAPSRLRSLRRYLFGSLQTQIRLAVFGVVVAGFSVASIGTLLINQRELMRQHEEKAEITDRLVEPFLIKLRSDSSDRTQNYIRWRLADFATWHQLFWIQEPTGALLIPQGGRPPLSNSVVMASMRAHQKNIKPLDWMANLTAGVANRDPEASRSPYRVVDLNGRRYLTHLDMTSQTGSKLWVARDITNDIIFLSDLFQWLLTIWSVALGLTLLFISILTRQLLHPLQELNRMAEMITTESLDHAQIKLDQAPREVEELALVFNNLLERLGRSWNQQRDFVSAVSHELRNPLTIIGGYLRRLQRRGGNLSPEQLRALATAEAETQRITRLLNDLLDLSRSEAGRLQLLLKPVAVDEVLLTSCDLVRSQLPRRLELTLPTGDDSILAVTEADRLQQVVLNLIENADKYSPPGTPIQVILNTDLPDYLRITVRDRGIGIPADDQATIFERFQRGSNAAAKGSGSGLGLSVVKLLVDAMGGRISVESQLGEGSAFHLDLPRPPEATATPGPLPRRRPAQ